MTAIWHQSAEEWRPLSPVGFPDEAALHTLVETSPQMLPLAGNPELVVLGREVSLGGNSADLIAVEPAGRLAVIEIKLARNADARRAVIAQVLTYAAYLQGLDAPTLENTILARHLHARGYRSVAEAVSMNDQQGAFDSGQFEAGLSECLSSGHFRVVVVLDEAPNELVRLCGYIQSISDRLLLDLITVSSYEVGGSKIMVPQRVEPELSREAQAKSQQSMAGYTGTQTSGHERYEAAIADLPEEKQPTYRRLIEWARQLEDERLVRLECYEGKSQTTLLPRLQPDNVGLVTIGMTARPLWFFRSVSERKAPEHIPEVERLLGAPIGQGTTAEASEPLLEAIGAAYRTAAKATL